jgi:hypothetical protein
MNNESLAEKEEERGAISPQPPLLKILEDMLHNKIKKKQEEIYRTQNIGKNDRISTEIETLHWVLAQSLSIRRRLGVQGEQRYYY